MSAGPAQLSGAFSVLAVCTGNICRSPAFEAGLRSALGADADVAVSSAGLRARVAEPIDPRMGRLLSSPLPGFQARQATADLVTGADLVLVMTRAQRAALVSSVPSALRRTFTVREFAALTELAGRRGVPGRSPGQRLAALAALTPRLRSALPPGRDDDIEDPHGAADEVYERVAREVHAAVATVADIVVGSATPPPGGPV
jgi:protein-tyrosine phosphatase